MEKQEHFNIVSIFLTKFIFQKNFDSLKKSGFINSYVSDPNIIETVDLNNMSPDRRVLFLLFRSKRLKKEDFKKIVQSLKVVEDTDIILSYDLINDYVMIVIDFPKKYINDYKYIMQGKYSKLSKEFKDTFPSIKDVYNSDNIRIGMEHTIYYHVFNKTDWLKEFWLKKLNLVELDKDLELWEKPKDEDIIFNINKLIKQ